MVALLVLLFVLNAARLRFTQDDAYISLRYARNLVEGHGLVFNEGQRVEGYSNFSWTLLLALLLALRLPALAVATWIGVACAAAAIVVAARCAKSLEGRWGPGAMATALLLAGNSAYTAWSTSGMETGLYTLLVTLALVRGLREPVGREVPLLFAAAALTRPEGPLLFALWIAARALDLPPSREGRRAAFLRSLARDVAWWGVPVALHFAGRLAYYGDIVPNTAHAKAGLGREYLVRGVEYAADFFRSYGIHGVVPALAIASLLGRTRRSPEARLLAVWLGHAVYVVLVGGDVLYFHRFWVPLMPLGAILVARGMQAAAHVAIGPRAVARAGAICVAVAVVLVSLGIARNDRAIRNRIDLENALVDGMARTGIWLKQNLPRNATLATTTIGAVAWTSELRILDMIGLTDSEVARHPQSIEGLSDDWRETSYNAEVVLRRRPDAILFATGLRPSAAAEKALFLYDDFHRSYYAYPFRSVPALRHPRVLFLRKPDASPAPIRIATFANVKFVDTYAQGHAEGAGRAQARLFARAAELGPASFVAAREWEGVARFLSGDPRGAEILEQVAREDPYAIQARLLLAEQALDQLRDDDAEALLARVRDVDPHEAQAWVGLAAVEQRRGHFEEAYRSASEAARLWSGNASYHVLLGELAARLGRYGDADTHYRAALSLEPGSPAAVAGLQAVERARSATGR